MLLIISWKQKIDLVK